MHKIPKPCNRLIPVFGRILIGRLGELIVGFVGQSLGGKSGEPPSAKLFEPRVRTSLYLQPSGKRNGRTHCGVRNRCALGVGPIDAFCKRSVCTAGPSLAGPTGEVLGGVTPMVAVSSRQKRSATTSWPRCLKARIAGHRLQPSTFDRLHCRELRKIVLVRIWLAGR